MADDATMPADEVRSKVLEFAAIAKECPENLQERCFELLLGHYLDGLAETGPRTAAAPPIPPSEQRLPAAPPLEQGQEDIARGDVHLKAMKFLERYGLTLEDLNQVFYKDGDNILPLYEDLKTTKTSECQLRIALMLALRTAIKTGEFTFNGEAVRSECQTRKCYDAANFASTFRRYAEFFDGLEKYESSAPTVRLSEGGRKMLSELVKTLR